jgi:flagellar protein FliO/FliZ
LAEIFPAVAGAFMPLAAAVSAFAAEGEAAGPLPGEYSWGGYFYGIGALCLILALLYALLWLMRRSGKFRFLPAHDALSREALRLEARLPLGPRQGLVVVRFLNKRVLLGVTERQITLLSEADIHDEPSKFSKTLEDAARQETDA